MTDRELIQMALDLINYHWDVPTGAPMVMETKIALMERLAQPEAEPVAWDYNDREVLIKVGDEEWRVAKQSEIISALLPPPQEFVCSTGLCHYKNKLKENT